WFLEHVLISFYQRAQKRKERKQIEEELQLQSSMSEDLQLHSLQTEEFQPETTKNVSVQTTGEATGPETLKCFSSTVHGNDLATQVEHVPKKKKDIVKIRGFYKLP